MTKVTPGRLSHMNAVIDNYQDAVKHFVDVYDGNFMLDLPGPNWNACLIEIGGVITEFFGPFNFMLNTRNGAHWLGVEYEAPMKESRAAVAANNIRIYRDLEVAFHTNPADGFGVDYELYEGTFFGPDAPNVQTHSRDPGYWRNEHPAGMTGIVGYTHVVADLDATGTFLENLFGSKKVYDAERPALGAIARGYEVSDHVVELLQPSGPGPLLSEMMRTGEGIRSSIIGVADLAKAQAHFESKGLPIIAGTQPDSFAIDPEANFGLLFEFALKP
ncbi:MAG: hypothetical protein KDE32_07240 [Novosphingobium sp.]|nr:hypothetical protein [Novosphingobium sp.]